jgi:high-affinity iron transporter
MRGVLLVPLMLLALLGCTGPGGDAAREDAGTVQDSDPDPAVEVLPGTPPGGLVDWVADIREGLRDVPELVAQSNAADPVTAGRPAAEDVVLELYLGRQEFIERYYGTGGPRDGGEALDAAVLDAESRFHEVLRLAGASPPADATSVRAAINRLSAALDRLLLEAEEAGVSLDAPAGSASGGDATDENSDASTTSGAGAAAEDAETTLASLRGELTVIEAAYADGRHEEARRIATRLYLDHYEPFEVEFGPGSDADPYVTTRVTEAEVSFHALLRTDVSGASAAIRELDTALAAVEAAIQDGPPAAPLLHRTPPDHDDARLADRPGGASDRGSEIAEIRSDLAAAQAAFEAGDAAGALAAIETTYLNRFEPLEPLLAASRVHRIERLFHLELRPAVARGESGGRVTAAFQALDAELAEAEAVRQVRAPFWFGAFNAFAIIVREGLEAALLIAAILAYLAGVSADSRHRRLIYVGALVGIVASFATWGLARSIVSVSGAGRELLEGITALLAVAVLLYVSHWLFHKSYVVDWTRYLRDGVGRAVSRGSALAMAALAFAAVYREGFETVLFYQALSFETGPAAVMAGFLPGLVLICAVGVGIVHMGIRLPMRRLFAITNVVLLYLAFSFLGKGLYALQEAGWYAASPVSWMPDRAGLRQLFGLYPVAQILAAQAAFLVLLGLTYAYYRWKASRSDLGGRRPASATEADSRVAGEAAPALAD